LLGYIDNPPVEFNVLAYFLVETYNKLRFTGPCSLLATVLGFDI
jgi:hypothetical protein